MSTRVSFSVCVCLSELRHRPACPLLPLLLAFRFGCLVPRAARLVVQVARAGPSPPHAHTFNDLRLFSSAFVLLENDDRSKIDRLTPSHQYFCAVRVRTGIGVQVSCHLLFGIGISIRWEGEGVEMG